MHERGTELEDLVEALSVPDAYPRPVDEVQLLQTHISVLFFAGDRVYKLKKPVQLDFLDYTNVDERRRFCEDEVRLNRRISPRMYLGVLPVTREATGAIHLDGEGEIVDWVVEMVRLPAERMLDALLDRGELDADQVQDIALVLARFHDRAMTGPSVNQHGLAPAVAELVDENIEQLEGLARRHPEALPESALAFLRESTARFTREHRALMEERVAQWRIREGHGDLHAGNICLVDGEVLVYDCVEFDRSFRCGDVASDLAFLVMDLEHRGHGETADRLVDAYARITSDAHLRELLPFYKTHRALVRAKVELATAEDDGIGAEQRAEAVREARRYGQLAVGYQLPTSLTLTCGLPAAGKSFLASHVSGRLRGALLRTDVLRKETGDDSPSSDSHGGGRYTTAARGRVYRALHDRAVECLEDDRSVVADATFSRAEFRKPLVDTAARLEVPCHLVVVEVDEAVACERLRERGAKSGEPSDADFDVYRTEKQNFDDPEEDLGVELLHVSGTDSVEDNTWVLLSRMIERESPGGDAPDAPRSPIGW